MFRLLIVDDEKVILQGIRALVEKRVRLPEPVELRTAASAVEALRLLAEFVPDLILTDIRMPVIDGFAFLERARCLGIDCDAAILTSHADFDYARRAIAYHVEEYLLKPVETEQLQRIMERAFDKKQAVRREEERDSLLAVRNLLLYDLPPEQAEIEEKGIRSLFPERYFTVLLAETAGAGRHAEQTERLRDEISYFYPRCEVFFFETKRQYAAVCNHSEFFIDTAALKHNLRGLFGGDSPLLAVSISSDSWRELPTLYMNAQRRILYGRMYKQRRELADLAFFTYWDCVELLTEAEDERREEKLRNYIQKGLAQHPSALRDVADSFVTNCNLYLAKRGAPEIRGGRGTGNSERGGAVLAAAQIAAELPQRAGKKPGGGRAGGHRQDDGLYSAALRGGYFAGKAGGAVGAPPQLRLRFV